MSHDELAARLARSTPRPAPPASALLERAFPEHERRAPSAIARPALATAVLVLGVAATTPGWVQPTRSERERTEAFAAATVATLEACRRELNSRVIDHD